jgi:tol-pal system beta propeller repeat protein TolB
MIFKTIIFLLSAGYIFAQDLALDIQSQEHAAMPMMLGVMNQIPQEMKEFVQTLHKDLQMSGQFVVQMQEDVRIDTKQFFQDLAGQNIYVGLFIQISSACDWVDWRLYDTMQAQMIAGKRFFIEKDKKLWYQAHVLANEIWPVISGNNGCFCSKLAYCKKIDSKKYKNKLYKHIYMSDVHGDYARPFVQKSTILIAPRWNAILDSPLLFYSECTLTNVSLCMANIHGLTRTITQFDGISMLPSFGGKDGQLMVMCLTRDGSSQLYEFEFSLHSTKKKITRLTNNEGNNFAPCFIDDQTIAFASDFESKHPRIYLMHLKSKKIEPITKDGYCACPVYNSVLKELVYGKMVQGAMQLFAYSFETKKHEQLTTGYENKEEPTISPCGNYIAFCANTLQASRIAVFNRITGKTKYITASSDYCSYPSWSPEYTQYFV